jgi:hypothetical protein
MNELEQFIAELQRHADNWESKMWIIKPIITGFENVIELGMEEV